MKNGLLIWNVVLTVIAGYLLITHFGSKKTGAAGGRHTGQDSAAVKNEFRIAYFEMDSVEANFEMVKDIKSEIGKKEDAINIELDRLGKEHQNKLMFYQNKQKEMTQQEYESAALDLRKSEQNIANRKQALDQEYSDFAMRKMKDIKLKIEEFVREYNKTKNYSYIVAEEPGFFYFKDTVYNITADVIKGLNAIYKTDKKN